MSNEELVVRIKAGIEKADNMLVLYQNMKGLIFKLAKRYQHYAELDDLQQEGYIALCKAVDKYEQGQCMFLTYAYSCIRRHMLRYVQQNSGFSDYMGQHIRKYNQLCTTFAKEYNRKPSVEEVSYYLQAGTSLTLEIINAAQIEHTASLDSPVGFTDEGMTLADVLAGNESVEEDILEKVQREQMKKVLWETVDSLPGSQPDMIRKKYINNMTLKEIGETYNAGIEMARQGINKGLKAIKMSKGQLLLPFLDDYINTNAYHGNGVGQFNRTWTSSTERVALKLVDDAKT